MLRVVLLWPLAPALLYLLIVGSLVLLDAEHVTLRAFFLSFLMCGLMLVLPCLGT
ncbi:hypothetical protein [Plastoroseomonas arctica]|uniref:Uncharacterized protein n=1 Tax=Plastoroseomonas arctica TaxID=1509237 RepID=A0AAF1K3Z7_9PROT|nr:hypothetical protein [Plastoroseomonas arctica]MBR0655430.1 hypothetical protein [Plastoroseomonas arctica]